MARIKKPLTREYLLTILQTRTQKEAAKFLGIGERTIRRIKNEPGHVTTKRVRAAIDTAGPREIERLRKPGARALRDIAQKEIEKQTRKQRAQLDFDVKGIRAAGVPESEIKRFIKRRSPTYLPKKARAKRLRVQIPRLAVMPPYRRATRLDPSDRSNKKRMLGDVIRFDARKLNTQQIFELLRFYRSLPDYAVNIIYGVPAGGASMGGRKYRKRGNSATGWLRLSTSDDSEDGDGQLYDDASMFDMLSQMQEIQLSGKRKPKRFKQNIRWIDVQRL